MRVLRYWNWKAAVFSALWRCPIFFFTTVRYGWRATLGAVGAEFWYRFISSGALGALTEELRDLRPPWLAWVVFVFVMPALGHLGEAVLHWVRGTPNLRTGLAASLAMTLLSTLFTWYAMRQGAFLTGRGANALGSDLRRVPWLIAGFVALGPLALWRSVRRLRPAGATLE